MTAELHRLANGLTVAVDPMPGVETLSVGLYADAGARSEPLGLSGLAHMVEHMVFKGAGNRDARAIAEDIEDVGGSLNAWTSRETTAFQARLLPGDLQLGVEVIADFVRAPRFDVDELEREKSVVLSELGEARDTPDDIVFDHLNAACFPGQPLGQPVLGSEDSIAAIAVADLRDWLAIQYRPDGLILAAAGRVDADLLLGLAEARFGDLPAGRAPRPVAARFNGGSFQDKRRFDQVHLAFVHEGLPANDPDMPALNLFSQAAGGGMSSRLFQEVREELGLAYSIYSWAAGYADTGVLGVYCATDAKDAARALALSRSILAATADSFTDAELARSKAQARAGLLMSLESVQTRADVLARGIDLRGRIVAAAELVAEIDAVSVADVRRVAARVLAGPTTLATVGGKLALAA
ncbi:MAG TPA: pitrilysin family protein [Sphingomonadaceae bacterium]|nr:pitrilysin family protein [Sphingomonadaceae bacterium]